ncbi:hypothetical protein CAOG_01040 [Capsaspora owczarzaki ATCC 30864]|nr:hypothetical protein CAOG_01040 [Capsaspora owczarzaki ATCC 30864]|eukprot:XP_004365911.1 hypothetical protein CAOG_01040 [Capsaspora owczarzaki ATCC 30864]
MSGVVEKEPIFFQKKAAKPTNEDIKITLTCKTTVQVSAVIRMEIEGGPDHFFTINLQSENCLFGVPPNSLPAAQDNGYNVPVVLQTLRNYFVNNGGPDTVGIFRGSGEEDQILAIKRALNHNSFSGTSDINAIATVIKIWFRDLPQQLLNELDHATILKCEKKEQCIEALQLVTEPQRTLLMWLLDLLADVASHERTNQMNAQKLAICIAPNLFSTPPEVVLPPQEYLRLSQAVVTFVQHLLTHRIERNLHRLRLQNFKKFEDITFTLTPSPKIIVGANGSGKTQVLWATLIFLRGHNARVRTSRYWTNPQPFLVKELKDLFGDPLFVDPDSGADTLVRIRPDPPAEATKPDQAKAQTNASPSAVPVTVDVPTAAGSAKSDQVDAAKVKLEPIRRFTLTGTFHDATYHGKSENVEVAYSLVKGLLLDTTHESLAPIRFAFMQPTYQWGDRAQELHRDEPFLTAGVQYLRSRLFQAKDFVNDGLRQLGFLATVAAPNKGGPAIASVTENGVTLDIGACAGSLQKIIAILTLLYHLTPAATTEAAKEDARIVNNQHTFTQRIFLIDELEALLYENVTAKLYEFLVNACAKHDIQLIVATNSRAIIEPRLNTRREVLFLTPDGKAVELTEELPKDEENQQSLFPILNALSQVKGSKPLLVLEGANDQAFYSKYTTLGQHFQFMTTAGAVKKESISYILRQANLKHVFMRDSDMYAASSDLPAAQARITKHVGSPVIYTQLPCVESYLLLSEMLQNAGETDKQRHLALEVILEHKLYFVTSFKSMLKESGLKESGLKESGLEPSTMPTQRTKEQLSCLTFEELKAAEELILLSKEEKDELFRKAKGKGSASEPAKCSRWFKLRAKMNADPNDPEAVWSAMFAQQQKSANASSSPLDSLAFWTAYVKMVHGKEAMVCGPDGTPTSTDVMIRQTPYLHHKVQALLNQTVQAVLKAVSE